MGIVMDCVHFSQAVHLKWCAFNTVFMEIIIYLFIYLFLSRKMQALVKRLLSCQRKIKHQIKDLEILRKQRVMKMWQADQGKEKHLLLKIKLVIKLAKAL